MASEIFVIQGSKHGHELFHVKQDCGMITGVLLAQMERKFSRWELESTEKALAAHQMQDVQVLP